MCFVLNDYSDDPDSSAFMVGQNVPLPTELARQTPLTPIGSSASAVVDTQQGGIFDAHAMDDTDEPWLSVTEHQTGWNKDFKSGTYRGMLYGIVLRDYPQQVESLAKTTSVQANVREFLFWAQRHCRIPRYSAKQVSRHLLVRVQVGANFFHTKVRVRVSSE